MSCLIDGVHKHLPPIIHRKRDTRTTLVDVVKYIYSLVVAGFGGPENDDLYHPAPLSRSLPSAPEGFCGPYPPPLSFFINDLPNLLHALPTLFPSFAGGGIGWDGGRGGPGGGMWN